MTDTNQAPAALPSASISYALPAPDEVPEHEDWTQITDRRTKKRVQNRVAQREHRRRMKARIDRLEEELSRARQASAVAAPAAPAAGTFTPNQASGTNAANVGSGSGAALDGSNDDNTSHGQPTSRSSVGSAPAPAQISTGIGQFGQLPTSHSFPPGQMLSNNIESTGSDLGAQPHFGNHYRSVATLPMDMQQAMSLRHTARGQVASTMMPHTMHISDGADQSYGNLQESHNADFGSGTVAPSNLRAMPTSSSPSTQHFRPNFPPMSSQIHNSPAQFTFSQETGPLMPDFDLVSFPNSHSSSSHSIEEPSPKSSPKAITDGDARSALLEDRFDYLMEWAPTAGFHDFDDMVIAYYTAKFEEDSDLYHEQRISRRRGLPLLLAKLRGDYTQWHGSDRRAFQDEILKSAEDLLLRECTASLASLETSQMSLDDRHNLNDFKRSLPEQLPSMWTLLASVAGWRTGPDNVAAAVLLLCYANAVPSSRLASLLQEAVR